MLNPSFGNLSLGGGESSTKGRRELVDLSSEEVEREGEAYSEREVREERREFEELA